MDDIGVPAPLLLLRHPCTIRTEEESGVCELVLPTGHLRLGQISAGTVCALNLLCTEGATEEEIRTAAASDGFEAALVACYLVAKLASAGLLKLILRGDRRELLVIEGVNSAELRVPAEWTSHAWVLSYYSYLHPTAAGLSLQHPVSGISVTIPDPGTGAVICALGMPVAVDAISVPGISTADAAAVVAYLATAGLVVPAGSETDPGCAPHPWEFPDLLLHTSSRWRRDTTEFGATYRRRHKAPPLPAVKPIPAGPVRPLYRPDMGKVVERDPSLTEAIERRRSVREPSNGLTTEMLGEFLFRTVRVRDMIPADPAKGIPYEQTRRPYPSGGAAFELELYLTVDRCAGIDRGLYYYAPLEHSLSLISADAMTINRLLLEARLAYGGTKPPAVLLSFTSRFGRLSWKYSSIAYATTLKNLGALYQTMYLVATAMDLSPCALGSGSRDTLSGAANLDYLSESAVGEFVLC